MILDRFTFSSEQVCSLTKLSKRQLSYWDRTYFFSPELVYERRRVYSFRDLVALRTIAMLRRKVPLQELRKVGAWLAARYDAPWSTLRFFVAGRRVVFREPDTGLEVEAGTRQRVFPVDLESIASDLSRDIRKIATRRSTQIGQISRERGVVRNSYVVAGTRIPASAVWNLHQAGLGLRAIRAEYPTLTDRDVRAAVAFWDQERRRRGRAA